MNGILQFVSLYIHNVFYYEYSRNLDHFRIKFAAKILFFLISTNFFVKNAKNPQIYPAQYAKNPQI